MKKNIIVKKNSVTYQIPPQNVVYMEKDLRRIVIHLSGMASSELVVYGSFHDLIPNLDERFLYCHRSYIINMDEIIIMSVGGMPVEDVAWGTVVYRNALAKGIGVKLNLWETPVLS